MARPAESCIGEQATQKSGDSEKKFAEFVE